ncbi:hypothetical protein [Roseomonas sp. WA12]
MVGRAARELIGTEAYTTAMQSLEAYHIQAMLAAPEGPSGVENREHHHRMLCASRELAETLTARALAAAEIEQRLAARESDEEDLDL